MAKTFRLRGMLIPSTGRTQGAQGVGSVGGGVVASVGTPQESASTVINNINNVTNVVGGDYSKIVRITISDLLALDPTEVGENDLYIVYASGSDEDGWSGEDFTYDGNTYPAESFFQLINGEWQPITDEIDLSKSPKFGNLPEEVYMVEGLFPPTSYPNIYGRDRAGMQIAKVRRYRLDDAGIYQPVEESTSTPGGGTSVNDMLTINIPFARRYQQGGEYHYEGGVLTAADYRRLMEGQNIGAGGTLTFDAIPTANSNNPVTSGGVASALNDKANVDLSNLSADAITNVKSSGNRIATLGGVDIYETGRGVKSTLDTSSSANYVAYDYVAGVYEIRSASLLWNWFRINNKLPYFYDNHTQTPSARTQAGFYVGSDGVWWYDAMMSAIGWHKLVDDTQWQTSTSYVYKEDFVCSIQETTGTQAKLTVADFINSTNKIGRWFRYSLTFDGTSATGYSDPNWRNTNDNDQVAIFVYGKNDDTYTSVDALYADFLQMEITASLFLTSQKRLIKDNIFDSIEVTTYTHSGTTTPAIKFAFNRNIIPKLRSTGSVPFTINLEAKRVGNIEN